MWILETSGEYLQGKRMWLRPGQKYLFGRVAKDGVNFQIDHKTVSRKHFFISVGQVKDGDVGNVHARTSVTVGDLDSKAGTGVDGEVISSASKTVKKDVISIRPGSLPHELVISWVPCTFSYGLNKKELKNGVLLEKQQRLKDLDIKVVNDYLPGQTTHMVSQKRNTSKTLQALIEGKPLITEEFVEDLIYATAPQDPNAEESFSSLETNFEASWPEESKFLPPAGKEPTTKPDEAYNPNPERARIFEKHTFFFFDQAQCDLVSPPINVGHGKALYFEITERITKHDDALKYIRNAVGASGIAVIIKPNEQEESWRSNFVEKLCVKLGQESTEQAALLDAILANNTSQLHKSLNQPTTSGGPVRPALEQPSPQQQTESMPQRLSSRSRLANGINNINQSSSSSLSPAPDSAAISQLEDRGEAPETSQTSQQSMTEDVNPRPRKRARFAPVLESVKAFDDDFDPSAAVPYEDESAEEEVASPPKPPRVRASQGPRVTTARTRVKAEPVSTPRRKGTPDSFADDSDDGMVDLLPGIAAMDREKKEAEARAIREGRPLKIDAPPKAEPAKPRKEAKAINVREASRAKRDADEARAQRAHKELEEMQKDEEGKTGPRDLVKIQNFELPVREKHANGYRGQDWKPEWDGRANYKGFRRAREGDAPAPRRDKIIVPIVPWTGSSSRSFTNIESQRSQTTVSQKSNRSRPSQLTHRSQRSRQDSDSEEENQPPQASDEVDAETSRLQKEAAEVLDHPVDITAPRQTRHGDAETQSSAKTATQLKTARNAKRPASSTLNGHSTTAKKQKTQRAIVIDDSDGPTHGNDDDSSDGGMGFTFGKSRQGRGKR